MSSEFLELHSAEHILVMPNAWDVGSAKLLAHLGFEAVATTSGGHAFTLGRLDQNVGRAELVEHAAELAIATPLPLNVDAESCFPDESGGIARTIELLGATGAAGCSIEDFSTDAGEIEPFDVATEQVRVAAEAARASGLVLTARAENHLYGIDDLDDTLARLCAYREAGADVVYAPGLTDLAEIERVVRETALPVNVLLRPNGPSVTELEEIGVARVSVGAALARVAYGALFKAAQDLRETGLPSFADGAISTLELAAAFGPSSM